MNIEWTAEAASNSIASWHTSPPKTYPPLRWLLATCCTPKRASSSFPKPAAIDADTDTFDRFIPRTRIVLTYAIRNETIWVITVWHTSRNPGDKPQRR